MSPASALLAALAELAAETEPLAGSPEGGRWALDRLMDSAAPLAVVAGVILILLVSMRIKKRNRDLAPPEGRSRAQTQEQRARNSIDRMTLDLEEAARSVSALLDTKIRVLDKLIRDADERIRRLEEAGGGSGPPPARDGQEPARAAPAPGPRPEETLAHHAHIYGLADQGLSVLEIAEQTGYQRGEVELVLSLRRAARSGDS